jgi:hypothetical protein
MIEAPLVRGGSDAWFPCLHSGGMSLGSEHPAPGATLGVGENRVTRDPEGTYEIEFSDRSKWTRTSVSGQLHVRPLAGGSGVIHLTTSAESEGARGHAWQILAPRTEVTGTIRWIDVLTRRHHELNLEGLGYLDRSAGRLPLSPELGRWLWGRFQGTERTVAYYRLDPADAPLEADGRPLQETATGVGAGEFLYEGDRSGGALVEGGRILPHRIRRNRWGMPHPLEIRGLAPCPLGRAPIQARHSGKDSSRTLGPLHASLLSAADCHL